MWELDCEESWAPKNWCFWTVVLEKTPESLLDCKEIQPVHPNSPGCSLEGLMLKLKLQYFGHLMRRADSLEKTLMLGKIEGRRRREWQKMRWSMALPTQWTWVWVNSESWWWTGRPGVLQSMGSQKPTVRQDWVTELNWTGGLDCKESACSVGDLGLLPGSGRFPEGNDNPIQYPCLVNPKKTGRPLSMGSQRAGLNWVTNTFTFSLSWELYF